MSESLDEGALRGWLTRRVAEITGLPASTVDADRPLTELGLSSVHAVSLTRELAERIGRTLPETIAWEMPTIASLAAQLSADHGAPSHSAVHRSASPPVAVVGLGCRLPGGVNGPADFWDLLRSGADGITDLPAGRWAAFTGDHAEDRLPDGIPRQGGFLADIAGFDAEFFGITPREATLMDPQQRILLEVAIDALDHAGIPADTIRGSQTGVFVGVSAHEYAHLTTRDLADIQAWTATGAAPSIIANRLSYLLDLRGPSMVIDTACSSSLVAVHQAVRALADGEIDRALVAGVNLLLAPAITANFALAGALAADGRCKAFAADADGMTRGEGCGVVVLERLADARRADHRVLAVIRGSAVNQDGRSNGLMAPNPVAQRELLHRACARADVDESTVDYVEAHGTGTPLGDPIEASALGAALGRGRPTGRPLLIGSVKSNIGHLEGAAGIAGLIKVVLAMVHDRIPASLHCAEPNPRLRLAEDRLSVVTATREWPRYSGRAVAGVSAFGFGGTNAHVVLEEWPHYPAPARPSREIDILALAEPSADRVPETAKRLANWLSGPGQHTPLGDLAHTLARRRASAPYRTTVIARDRRELLDGLREVADGHRDPIRSTAAASGVVWVFSGFGAQYPGMARNLLATEPAFAAEVLDLDEIFQAETGFSLHRAIATGADHGADLYRAQLSLFGSQLALSGLWRSVGVLPAAVIGSSMGELAAAVACGALSLPDALRVMSVRARLLAGMNAEGLGAMAVLGLSEAEFNDLAPEFPGTQVAVYASPGQLTVSGPGEQVPALVAHVERMGRLARALRVSGAGHSPAVEPLLAELRAELADLTPDHPTLTWYRAAATDPRAMTGADADYWAANLRRPVRQSDAVLAAIRDGHRAFLEVGPHPTMSVPIEQTLLSEQATDGVVLGTLSRTAEDQLSFSANLAGLHHHGHPTALSERHAHGDLVDLPTRTWRHRTYWFTPTTRTTAEPAAGTPKRPVEPAAESATSTAHRGASATEPLAESAAPPRLARDRESILARLRIRIADIAGFRPADLDPTRPLTALGLDSLMAQRALNAVNQDYGITLPLPLLLRGATLAYLADYLHTTTTEANADEKTNEPQLIAPRDPAERLVARVWQDLAGADTITMTDRIDADPTELATRLSAELDAEITAETLLAAPTLAELADLVRDQVNGHGTLRTLRTGTHPPLFLFHPAGGPTSVYRPLIARLSPGPAGYGLDRVDELREVEDRAAHYVELIRTVQATGPYRLAGWSFGGCLAFEVARQLTDAGAEVDLVALIDTILPLPEQAPDPIARYQRFAAHIEATYGLALTVNWPDLAELDEDKQVSAMMDALRNTGIELGDGVLHHQYTSFVDSQAAERYQPKPYAGRVQLYRAAQPHQLSVRLDPRYLRTDESLGWDEFCPNLSVHTVPGDHLSIIDPPLVDAIASHLDGLLR